MKPGLRGLILPGVAALAALAVLLGLGAWQLQRRAWKENLIAQIEARARGEPGEIVPEARWGAWDAQSDAFRRVRLTGRFLHDRQVALHGLLQGQRGAPTQGYYLFTPLQLGDGAIVFVNRGFVPPDFRAAERRQDPQGEVTVTGLVRQPEERTPFVPSNDPAREEWFVRDPAEMARARGLSRVAPFTVDADATPNPGGWPRGGQTPLVLPNNHLQYAFTWFGIALTLLGVFAVFARSRLRGTG